MRLRTEPGEPLIGPRIRVESDLSGGGSVFGITDSGGVSVNFMDPVDLDGDGAQELMLNRDPEDGLASSDWIVVDLVDGQLVELEQDDAAPLSWGDVPDPDDAGPGVRDGPVDLSRRDLALLVAVGAELPPVRHELRACPTPTSPRCGRGRSTASGWCPSPRTSCASAQIEETRQPCTGDEAEDLPAFFPEETDLIGVGESFTEDVDFDGRPDTIALEGTVTDGSVEDGDVELVVTTTSYGEKRWPVPAGWAPQVYARTIQIGMVDGLSLLVSQEGGDSTTLTYVATGSEGSPAT